MFGEYCNVLFSKKKVNVRRSNTEINQFKQNKTKHVEFWKTYYIKIVKSLAFTFSGQDVKKTKKLKNGGGADTEGAMKLAFSTFYFEGFGTNICPLRM